MLLFLDTHKRNACQTSYIEGIIASQINPVSVLFCHYINYGMLFIYRTSLPSQNIVENAHSRHSHWSRNIFNWVPGTFVVALSRGAWETKAVIWNPKSSKIEFTGFLLSDAWRVKSEDVHDYLKQPSKQYPSVNTMFVNFCQLVWMTANKRQLRKRLRKRAAVFYVSPLIAKMQELSNRSLYKGLWLNILPYFYYIPALWWRLWSLERL